MDSFDQLFKTFNSVSKEEWKEKVIKDLKGKAYEELIWKDEDGIEHQPYYKQSDLNSKAELIQKKQAWKVVQSYSLEHWANLEELKKEIEVALENGLQLAIIEGEEISDDLMNQFEELGSVYFYSRKFNADSSAPNQFIDPIGECIQSGKSEFNNEDFCDYFKEIKDRNSNLLIDGLLYAEKGASASEELAYILWHLTDYFDILTEGGLDPQEIADSIYIKCSIGPSYFSQLSKIRSLRMNVKKLFAYYGVEQEPMIWAESNSYFLDEESFNNNLIRLSCQGMSAVLGNADWISLSIQGVDSLKKSFAARMCRNIQLILKHESHLDELDDLVRGAYYIEELSNELQELSWNKFMNLESSGMLLKACSNESFWRDIENTAKARLKQYQLGEKVMIGVNKYDHPDQSKGEKIRISESTLSNDLKKEA